MANLEITVLGDPQAELLARNIVQDIESRRELGHAAIKTRDANAGEKGIVEIGQTIVVTLMESGGGQLIADLLRNVLGMTPNEDTKIVVKGSNGGIIEVSRKMSPSEFEETRDALVAMLKPAG